MVKLIDDDPGAECQDIVLEVGRVEDARTVRQRLRIPAAHWRAFLEAQGSDATPASPEQAYLARKEFWDWLATAHADTLPPAPLEDPHTQPVSPQPRLAPRPLRGVANVGLETVSTTALG